MGCHAIDFPYIDDCDLSSLPLLHSKFKPNSFAFKIGK